MEVATAAGLGLAVPGVLDALIKTCLAGYSFIRAARSADKDFENHRYQFEVEQQRLKDLTADATHRIENSTLKTDDRRFLLISSTLIRISQEFSDFKRLKRLYGIDVASSNKSTERTSKRSLISGPFGLGECEEDTNREMDALDIVLGLKDLHLDENLTMSRLQTLESPYKSVTGTFSRLRWACLDSKKVQILITKLQQYNSNIVNLVDGLKNDHRFEMPKEIASTTKNKPYFMVPFPKNKRFIGKSHISSWFEDYRKHEIACGHSEDTEHLRLALCGLGGIGKTQDVLSFIYKYQNLRSVFWIHAGNVSQFEDDYQKLASLAKIPGHDDTKQNPGLIVKRWLESPESGDWILVFDNADNMLDFYPVVSRSNASKENATPSFANDGIAKFVPRGFKGTIIITTRDREVARNLANQNVIFKPELNPEQATELFYHNYPKATDASDDTNTALQRLLKELQYLPLAIVQVAAYMGLNRTISPSEYLRIFESKKESPKLMRLLSKPHDNIWRENGENAETILTTFAISFRQLQKQSKLADSFLRFLACIDRKAIPRDLLFQIHLDDVKDDFLISEALDKLVNFSILQHANVDFGSGKGYEIHSLVHLAMQTYLGPSEMGMALTTASMALDTVLPFSEYRNWATWRAYLPHVMTLLENIAKDSEASADLCMKAGHHLTEALWRDSEALKLCERAQEQCTVMFGEEGYKTLYAMNNFANTLSKVGRLKEAQELQERVLEVRRRTLGEEHPHTLHCMHSLAVTYKQQGGRMNEAQQLEEKVLEVRRRTLGEEHPTTLICMYNLASTYKQQGGRMKEVQELQETVLELRRRTLGAEHPTTLDSMICLADTYIELGGRVKEVQELEEMVLEVRRRTLGEEHPKTLGIMSNLALTYRELGGRMKEVQELHETVLEVRRRTLGEEHPETLDSMSNLASTYTDLGGRMNEVQELEETVLEVRRRTLGEEHPKTLCSMRNLAITYRELGGRMKEVQELEEKIRSAKRG